MSPQQQRIQAILKAMEEIVVPKAQGVVAVGAILIDTLDLPIMIAVGEGGRIRYCYIEDEILPILLVAAVGNYFGPSEIIATSWDPIRVSKVSDLTTEFLEEYVRELVQKAELRVAPQDDLRLLLDQLSTLEAQILAARALPSPESVVLVPLHRRN